jgi:RNA polymerase sigma factor (sigma-70 family)
MIGDSAVAEEVAQEAFTRAWRHAGNYDARRGRVATWLLSITRNLAIDHLRAKRTEPLDPDSIRDAERAMWATSAREPGVDIGARELRESLGGLPAEQRRALLLAALFGFTAREIGEIEAIPVGTAKTRIRTATQKLVAAESAGDDRGEEGGR